MACALIRTGRCIRVAGRHWWCLGALALLSCAHHAYSWPPSYIRQTEFAEHYEMLVLGIEYWGEPLLAAGDSLRMQVRHDVCHSDVCASDHDALKNIEW